MRMGRRMAVVGAMSALVWASLGAGACGGEDGGTSGGATPPDMEGVIYAGGANDEALYALLTATAKDDPKQEAAIDTPEEGAMLPKDPAASFSWHISGTGASLSPSFDPAGALREWLGVRAAHAHGTPVNGRGYLLVFSVPGNDKLLRVFTTELSYTPDASAWSKLASAGAPITLTITNAIFEDSRVAQGGGPFLGEGVTFSVGP
ncbi:hypothetical protein E8A73_017030 [Polyangium aurulentum]|nr:hypothetical protein E8A73_017030 [Polyangium aurulentum]